MLIDDALSIPREQGNISQVQQEQGIQNPNLIPIPASLSRLNLNAEKFSTSQTPITSSNDNAMIIDKPDDNPVPQAAAASIITPNMIQTKKLKCGTVQHMMMPNNNVADSQNGQVRTIMVYDIPATWSHEKILESLKEWGQVLEISFKTQYKYQSVWCKMVLSPLADTDFVLNTWWHKLGGLVVRWYPGNWRLKGRKVREQFQASFDLHVDINDEDILKSVYNEDKSIVEYHKAKAWKTYKKKARTER
ncbi:hypothetical protein RclHR1_06940007 [Rhizophagus clarus]|uniref:RRM domain-containing protein n=1 Tax=Rhizophagus clarus TaxID=94130 RepID=A0A2Z6SAC2_9GLOM|nr:hypothetical protein RclHR1_06940007 [Rhizophagus clarus]GES87552.1 hypothetical protein GLOIN_2v1676095 [Rhizophagus clarus]